MKTSGLAQALQGWPGFFLALSADRNGSMNRPPKSGRRHWEGVEGFAAFHVCMLYYYPNTLLLIMLLLLPKAADLELQHRNKLSKNNAELLETFSPTCGKYP